MRNRMWREHKLLILAVCGIIVAVFSSVIISSSRETKRVRQIQVSNAEEIDHVFRSGQPWVVLCTDPDKELPKVFDKAAKRLLKHVNVGVMDCTQKLPSGKSVLQRFGLKTNISPTVFTVANGGKPQQVFLNYLQKSKALVKHVVEKTKKKMTQVNTSAHLDKCLSKAYCVLILRGKKFETYEKNWMQTLMTQHRKIAFSFMDATRYDLVLTGATIPPLEKKGQHRLVVFKKKNDKIFMKSYWSHFDLLPLQQFLASELFGFESLKTRPSIIDKKKKKEKKEAPVPAPSPEPVEEDQGTILPHEEEEEEEVVLLDD